MALLTATEVTLYSNISASAISVAASGLIPIIRDRIVMMTNNYFLTELDLQDVMTFNQSAGTIVANNSFDERNFLAGDDIYIYSSYRNDGYHTLASVSDKTLTITSATTVIDELSGASILISVVRWPLEVKMIAAQMIAYDYDVRPSKAANVKSRSLGPFSESFDDSSDQFGYPTSITDPLWKYRIARLM